MLRSIVEVLQSVCTWIYINPVLNGLRFCVKSTLFRFPTLSHSKCKCKSKKWLLEKKTRAQLLLFFLEKHIISVLKLFCPSAPNTMHHKKLEDISGWQQATCFHIIHKIFETIWFGQFDTFLQFTINWNKTGWVTISYDQLLSVTISYNNSSLYPLCSLCSLI